MKEALAHHDLRLAFQTENIHTADMILLLLIGMLAADGDAVKADRVIVKKSARSLILISDGHVLRSYRIALGSAPVGAKEHQGDHKTPEGNYILDRRNAKSRFYKSIHVSYPSEEDKKRASRQGVDPGGDIMIHGLPNGFGWLGATHRVRDWTDGCIAVSDAEMDEIWDLVRDGTPIKIEP
jgi:murein L,D-transpeptidase YafK